MFPIITLTTDFGLHDPFVGIMKGVILSICPTARLVDLTHDVEPQDILGGALALEAGWPYFPEGTVHLAVVDPGVGSARRPLAVRARGHYLVGPDNGLLTPALMDAGWRAVALTAPEYRLAEVSRTFHGRDVFAPAAAYLAAGVPLERLGPAVTDPVRRPIPRSRLEDGALVGEVLAVDRFGNLLTSIEAAQLVGLPGDRPAVVPVTVSVIVPLIVEVADRAVAGPVEAYVDGADGRPTAIVGSTGRLEIFVRGGRADQVLGAGRGARVRVRAGEG
ncbi:MAG TPA: SAM-dependent chlorinase/fluorinase [Methylomirabilota bacterium]|nr:SAM-dependent chlorinase/fluorinase [Methylomirabilota bacterium]